jgi:predicted RNA-binding Zn-ribbon protein involved in translation (DUF1610 family)
MLEAKTSVDEKNMSTSVMAGVSPTETAATPAPTLLPCTSCGKSLKVRAELVGKKIKCPKCGVVMAVPLPAPMDDSATEVEPLDDEAPVARVSIWSKLARVSAVALTVFVIIGCGVYANLSYTVTNRVNYKYFPPFQPYNDGNMNKHLGAEYHEIAKSILAGEGFANPFKEKTGPTAWMPPILPYLLASLLWICDNNVNAVTAIVVCMQLLTLIATAVIVLVLTWQTTERLWVLLAALIFLGILLSDFRLWFQMTHDCWFVLLALDLVIVGFVWCRPMQGWFSSVGWGFLGGVCALINPIVALAWGVLSLSVLWRERAWGRFTVAMILAALTLSPWVIRNYLVFGRLIPVKSNAAYELYQSHCLKEVPDGLLQPAAFGKHPYGAPGRERREYKEMGEMKFLDKKREIFWQSVEDDPLDFLDRVACRFLGATLWYVPFNRQEETRRPWSVWTCRVLHPLPFLAMLVLACAALWKPLHPAQWAVMGIYVLYLMPYAAISYYERYAMPLLVVKALLVIWACDCLLSLSVLLLRNVKSKLLGRSNP